MTDIQKEFNKWIDEFERDKYEFMADFDELYEDFLERDYYVGKGILGDLSAFVNMDEYKTEEFAEILGVNLISLEVLKYLILHRGRIPNIFIAYKDDNEMKLAVEDIVRDYNRMLYIGGNILAKLFGLSPYSASYILDFADLFNSKVKELGLYEKPEG